LLVFIPNPYSYEFIPPFVTSPFVCDEY